MQCVHFDFLGSKRAKHSPKWKFKNYIHHRSYFSNSVANEHGFLVHLCILCKVMMIFPGFFCFFFSCFQNFDSLDCDWAKRAKNGLKWQKDSVCCTSYLRNLTLWFSFMVHICKMIISVGFFFVFFLILIFWVVSGGKRAKNSPKLQKI